ncbi:MAG: sugar phosphate isomerase/epimerase, partial [Clostridia bacterium]|nr:sugar phosphate isomerase/epimerase [Clostridia bacterium]
YGIQLYSIRDLTEKNMEEALRQVSELGYKFVEFAGFFGIPAEEIKAMLDKYGLKVSGTHTGWKEIAEHFEETVAYHKAIGNKNIIIPGGDFSDQKKLDALIDMINEFQPKLAAEGITLGYHNHHKEFLPNKDGSNIEDQLIYRTNVMLEIDTYWAYVGMKNPIALLDRLGDRVKVIHIKDGDAEGNGTPLGMGTAPVADVYAKAIEMGLPMVVESETCNPDGMTEAKICIEYLKSLEK